MQFDQAKVSSREDKLERGDFVKQISGVLLLEENAPSLVVGIEGRWGSGKTTIINFIKEELRKSEKEPIIIDFNTWLISSLDSLIEGFFIQLAAGIGKHDRRKQTTSAAIKVLNFGKLLSPIKLIPGVEPWGTLVESVLSSVGRAANAVSSFKELDLFGKKEDLKNALSKLKRSIIVIIDDIDRLPPEQVHTIFQLIKAIGDFPRTAYLIAYDPEQVADALSYGKAYNGKSYLEKIIQFPYPVPRIGNIHKWNILQKALEEFFPLPEDEQKLFEYVIKSTVLLRTYTTLRDIFRVANRLHISAYRLKGEVCFPDLLVYETIALKFPNVVTFILNNPSKFIKKSVIDFEIGNTNLIQSEIDQMSKSQGKEDIKWLQDLISSYNENDQSLVQSLLQYLFTELRKYSFISTEPKCRNRLHNRDCLLKTLHCSVTSFTFSAKQAEEFCVNPVIREHTLFDLLEHGEFLNWISNITEFVENYPVIDPINFCMVHYRVMEGPEEAHLDSYIFFSIGNLLYVVIENLPSQDLRNECLNTLVKQKDCLVISETLLVIYFSKHGMWKDGIYYSPEEASRHSQEECSFSAEDIVVYKEKWLDTVREVAREEGIIESQKLPISILFRWGQFNNNDYSEVREYILFCAKDKQWLSRFLSFFNVNDPSLTFSDLIGDNAWAFAKMIQESLPTDDNAQKLADILLKRAMKTNTEDDIGKSEETANSESDEK